MTTTIDPDAMHDRAPIIDALPGEAVPYRLASGEGLRYEIDNQLWTVIARTADTGGLFDAAFILGPRGAGAAFHVLPNHQRSYHVFEGSVQFWLPGRSRVLAPGDSIHVPPGTPVAYRMLGHCSRILFFSAPGGALDALAGSGAGLDSHIYSADAHSGVKTPLTELFSSVGARAHNEALAAVSDEWDDALPSGAQAYFLRALTGDRRAWPDSLNSYQARGANTGGRYFSVLTLGGRSPYIPQHFHRHHTENFFVLSGRVWLYVNGVETLLTAGDYLHAPAGTIHSFAFDAHTTRMLGILTSDVFENFFDVTGEATDDLVHTEGLINPEHMMGKLDAAMADLDLEFVGPPPTRTRGLDL
ncbi:quercetin 2,3-dioxygenase [Gordonia sp. i37]|uniref:quercetin 2,3-dioxygenase n=1 Tax=Gordonia sp. i37 TaxID=1961707 RepID=UPI0009AF19A9|nr:quercetin 2,3-dioxygenase [Gordonia sp. i37]OPX09126.1 cupin [Gordonia sp. i37]